MTRWPLALAAAAGIGLLLYLLQPILAPFLLGRVGRVQDVGAVVVAAPLAVLAADQLAGAHLPEANLALLPVLPVGAALLTGPGYALVVGGVGGVLP